MKSVKTLEGVETEIAIDYYADRVLVLVTQLGKVGSLIQVSIPATVPLLPLPPATADGLPLVEPSPSVELTTLFGSAPSRHIATLYSLYASHIATLLWTLAGKAADGGDRRNIIVGLALKKLQGDGGDGVGLSDGEQATFRGVLRMIVELLRGTDR